MMMNGLRRGIRSDHEPAKYLRIDATPSASPSIIPTITGVAPRVEVRKTGNSG